MRRAHNKGCSLIPQDIWDKIEALLRSGSTAKQVADLNLHPEVTCGRIHNHNYSYWQISMTPGKQRLAFCKNCSETTPVYGRLCRLCYNEHKRAFNEPKSLTGYTPAERRAQLKYREQRALRQQKARAAKVLIIRSSRLRGERWVPVFGLEHFYEISNFARIRRVNGLKISVSKSGPHGYRSAQFFVDGVHITKRLHRVLWQSFRGPIPEGFVIHHKDTDRANNALSNLECIPDPIHRKHPDHKHVKGEENGQSVVTADIVKSIRNLHATKKVGYRRLSKMFNLSPSGIRKIIKRETWSALS